MPVEHPPEERQGHYPNEQALDLAIRVLNQALEADPEAINELMRVEVEVSDELALADHWSIQCGPSERDKALDQGGVFLRPLGLINGLFGSDPDQWGFIAMRVNVETGQIVRFERMVRKLERGVTDG